MGSGTTSDNQRQPATTSDNRLKVELNKGNKCKALHRGGVPSGGEGCRGHQRGGDPDLHPRVVVSSGIELIEYRYKDVTSLA